MDLFEGVNTLLQLDVVWWELCLESIPLTLELVAMSIRRAQHTLSSAVPSCSLTYCCVRAAKGEKEELYASQTLSKLLLPQGDADVMFFPKACTLSILSYVIAAGL